MTLCITIAGQWGIWQATDCRLTQEHMGKYEVVDDWSAKHVAVKCPDGGMLIAYSGLGRRRQMDLSEWIRRCLRGETRTVDQSLVRLRERANRDLAMPLYSRRMHHAFCFGGYEKGVAWGGVLMNTIVRQGKPDLNIPPGKSFEFETQHRQGKPLLVVAGAGAEAIAAEDWELLRQIQSHRPKRPADYQVVLADVIRRTATSKRRGYTMVSRASVCVYMPPSLAPIQRRGFLSGADLPPPDSNVDVAPFVMNGFDLTIMGVDGKAFERSVRTGSPAASEEERMQRAQESVTPDD